MRMRGLVVSAALLLVACGPDPNAVLPGTVQSNNGGHPISSGGTTGSGGTTSEPSSGGTSGTTSGSGGTKTNPFSGGATGSSGGSSGSGGVKSSGGVIASGGSVGAGGATGAGGVTGSGGAPGTGGTTGVGAECASAKTFTTGTTDPFGTGAVCFITCEGSTTYGWGCDSFKETDRTVTVNGTAVTCGAATLPPAKNGYYYFEIGAGGHPWDAIHLNAAAGSTCTPPAGSSAGTSNGGTSGTSGAGGSSSTPDAAARG